MRKSKFVSFSKWKISKRTNTPTASATWKPNARKRRQNNYPGLSIFTRLVRRIVESEKRCSRGSSNRPGLRTQFRRGRNEISKCLQNQGTQYAPIAGRNGSHGQAGRRRIQKRQVACHRGLHANRARRPRSNR